MKIAGIEFLKHPLFTGEKFDFKDKYDKATNMIIIAGENGLGKTSLLESLACVTTRFDNSKLQEAIFEYECTETEFYALVKDKLTVDELKDLIKTKFNVKAFSEFRNREYINNYEFELIKTNGVTIIRSDLTSQFESIRNVTYLAANNKSFGDYQLDPTQIKENSFMNMLNNESGNYKFKDSFQFLKKLTASPTSQKTPIFQGTDSQLISFNDLSTGEKQIATIATLFTSKTQLQNSMFLLDEPELGLHPKWQQKMIELFKDRVINSADQIIMTTHSPFLLQNDDLRGANLVIFKRDEKHNRVIASSSLSDVPTEKLLKDIFEIEIPIIDSKIMFVEGETDEIYLNKCIEVFQLYNFSYQIKWVGSLDKNGRTFFTGKDALNNVKLFLEANDKIVRFPIILLYDSDANKKSETKSMLRIETLPKNLSNKIFKRGIENLLNLPHDFNREAFYSKTEKADEYGGYSSISKLNKMKLCRYLCSLDNNQLKSIFKNLYNYLINVN